MIATVGKVHECIYTKQNKKVEKEIENNKYLKNTARLSCGPVS